MIKITVDSTEELNEVREVLHNKSCSTHHPCPYLGSTSTDCHCAECVAGYYKDKVRIYKRETVEIPTPIAV